MKTFRVLAAITVACVYLQIVLGSVVRITGSGLGCPDWPLCHGRLVPAFDYHTLIEYSHRLVGSATGVLVVATAVLGVVLYVRPRGARVIPRGLMQAGLVLLALYVLQGVLGGITVLMKNSPFTVAIHLGNAELVLGLALLTWLWAGRVLRGAPAAGRTAGFARWAYGGAVATYLIVLSGAYVVGSGATFACTAWPLCGATTAAQRLVDIHFLHRLVVGAAGAFLLVALVQAMRQWRGHAIATAAHVAAGAFVLEVAVGALQVFLRFPEAVRSLHVALATLVWAGAAGVAAAYWLEGRADESEAQRPAGVGRLTGAKVAP